MNARGKFRYTLLLAGSLCTAAPSFAAESTESVDVRITRLEKELAELKALLQTRPAAAGTAETPSAPVKKAAPPSSGNRLNQLGCQPAALRFCPFGWLV